jgi:hypothetical protein
VIDLRAAEIANMEDAMISVAKLMNDDIDGAEIDLKKGSSAFHAMGLGITTFMRSVLGFEKEIMAEANSRLAECENMAWTEQKKALKGDGQIYPPGSEYSLVHAEAQLMGAVVAVLHESLTEAIKGFMKLRKAYITLDALMQSETAYLNRKGLHLDNPSKSVASTNGLPKPEQGQANNEDTDLEFVEAPDNLSDAEKPAHYEGHLSNTADEVDKELAKLSVDRKKDTSKSSAENASATSESQNPFDGPDSDIFTSPVDVFVHSGANMCFGILLLMLSMVPPAFSRLLSIIGFRGDRERGVKMLWLSTRYNNINGAVSGLVLLAYYNGLLGFSDILPTEEDAEKGAIVGYPKERCHELLAKMRRNYPESRLWRLEEARGLSNARDIPGAIAILTKNTDSKMRQVMALNNFELSLDTMYIGDLVAMRDNFLRCVELNDWSHALYYFLAGCAELEMYREAVQSKKDDTEIQRHKKKAEELIRKAPTVAGKKRFMSKPLPFEQFVQRKVQKWEERAKELKIDFVDAPGVSPLQEMVYLWNGIKKMRPEELERAAQMLSRDRLTAPEEAAEKIKAEKDEESVRSVCLSAIYRTLGRLDEAKELCEEVLKIDK